MDTVVSNIPHYDLSDYRYQRTQITLVNNQIVHGQFVQFSVSEEGFETFYQTSHLCFLPAENKNEFWDFFNSHGGVFTELPKYILLLQIADISKILIEPLPSTTNN